MTYQAEGVSITAGDSGMASGLGDPSERADRAMPETAALTQREHAWLDEKLGETCA